MDMDLGFGGGLFWLSVASLAKVLDKLIHLLSPGFGVVMEIDMVSGKLTCWSGVEIGEQEEAAYFPATGFVESIFVGG